MEGTMALMIGEGTSATGQQMSGSNEGNVVDHDKSNVDAAIIQRAIKDKGNQFRKALEGLKALAAESDNWTKTELAATRARLYSILERCYQFYLNMKTHSDASVRNDMREALSTFVAARRITISDSANDMSRIVKVVFGDDRRRVSAYSLALRAALTSGSLVDGKPTPVKVQDLSGWLSAQGGVEEVRLGSKNAGLTAKERANAAKTVLNKRVLETCKFKSQDLVMDTDDNDKMVVLVATYRPTGQFEINAVIKKNEAVRAALVAHYSDNREKIDSEIRNVSTSAKPKTAVGRMFELA